MNNKPNITLFLVLFLFNLLFEIVVAIYDNTAIKFDFIIQAILQTAISVTLFVVFNEFLTPLKEMSENVRMAILSIIIGIVTKYFNIHYNFSRH